ncbi:unnamed protein product [Didymodactylos carnosus]|uniref:Peptidase M20 domain-containing protein 2 n=1 Tax=Didymodactylos carnosus TaxID=1234261 RepID=A0A814MKT1_9BILA|nr:unnamed protein product [Didymodactylos carnosus]CAF3846755.1 unnamed protein product [Didymodactylos carnosus]
MLKLTHHLSFILLFIRISVIAAEGNSSHYQISSIINDTYNLYDTNLRYITKKIHEYRETAYNEYQSAKLLADFLEKEGFLVERGIANRTTAFVATYESGDSVNTSTSGRIVSFNSEYDALPVLGHACGHNLIAIAGLGAALAVKAYLNETKCNGTVKLFGTPAEETGGGKIDLVNHGYYKTVDMNIMVHPTQKHGGAFVPYLALQGFEVEYFGKAAHAAGSPWAGKNALDALLTAFNSLNALRQQLHPSFRLHGIILNGGTAANIIPDYTRGEFVIRAPTVEQLQNDLKPRVVACFEAAAIATGCQVKITKKSAYNDVKQNAVLGNRYELYSVVQGTLLPSKQEQSLFSTGSTDQGYVSYAVPSIHADYRILTENNQGPHTKEFELATISEKAYLETIKASKALAATAIDFLEDDVFAKNVIDEFQSSNTNTTATTA